jgi:hypothetical protein
MVVRARDKSTRQARHLRRVHMSTAFLPTCCTEPAPPAGSCGFGYLFKDEPLGWDVAAMPDFMDGYEDVSC